MGGYESSQKEHITRKEQFRRETEHRVEQPSAHSTGTTRPQRADKETLRKEVTEARLLQVNEGRRTPEERLRKDGWPSDQDSVGLGCLHTETYPLLNCGQAGLLTPSPQNDPPRHGNALAVLES